MPSVLRRAALDRIALHVFASLASLASLAALAVRALLPGALILLAPAASAHEASPGATPQVRAGYDKVANEVLCYCGCARQTIRECTCSIAMDLRTDWERRLAAGTTPEAIIAEYIGEHGEQSRNVPEKKGINLIAWFGPGIAIVVAGTVIFFVLSVWAARGRRERAAAGADAAAGAGLAGAGADDAVRERLERDLREFDA